MKVTDEELITKSPDFLLASMEAAMTDLFHNMKVSENITIPGNKIKNTHKFALKCLQRIMIYFYGKAESLFQRLGQF